MCAIASPGAHPHHLVRGESACDDSSLLCPAQCHECLKILAERGVDTKLVAGGTDLLPQLKNALLKPCCVVDLSASPN